MGVQQGERVVILGGMYRCSDGSDAEKGEVGWVVGFRGLHDAVVSFDTMAGRRYADIPVGRLRGVRERSAAR